MIISVVMSIPYSAVTSDTRATGLPVGGKMQHLPAQKHPDEPQLYIPRQDWYPSQFPSDIFSRPGVEHKSDFPKVDYIEHADLRVALTVATAPVRVVQAERFFEQSDLIDPTNPSQPFQTHYDDTAQAMLINKTSPGNQAAIFKTSNVESDSAGKYGPGKELAVGTHYFYIPLMNSVFSNIKGAYTGDMVNKLILSLRVPSTIIVSGSGTITASIQFGITSRLLNEKDRQEYRRRLMQHAIECNFLQPHRIRKSQVLTPGAENFLDLNSVPQGVVAYHQVLIRPSGAVNTNNGRMLWYNIGDANDARVDLIDVNSNSITGSLPTRFLRQHGSAQMFDNDFYSHKPSYIIPYCASVNAAANGKVVGGRYFRSQCSERLRLTLPAAAVSEVQTLTQSATPAAGGWYRLRFRGEESAILLGNATVAQMKAAFEAMRNVQVSNITVTFSAVASAGGSLTATFSDPEGSLTGDLLEICPGDAFAASSSTARTTAGVPGLPSAQAYDIDIYSFMYKTANFNGSQFFSRDLAALPPSAGTIH